MDSESIKDRLAHILRAKNITATQFAEMMQIQPSNVSHLLSGRNKPSLDFLMKLKEIFPEYSFDWIILGKKPITISERQNAVKENSENESEQILHTDITETNGFIGLFDSVNEKPLESKEIVDDSVNESFSKKVRQIIYVYEDHTFEIYDNRI